MTALSDFAKQTGAYLAGCVAAHWPDAGFAVPAGERRLAAGKPVIIQDAFVELHRGLPDGDARAAECFLHALGTHLSNAWAAGISIGRLKHKYL